MKWFSVPRSQLRSAGTCDEMAAVSTMPEGGSCGAAEARQEVSAGCVDIFDSWVSFDWENVHSRI